MTEEAKEPRAAEPEADATPVETGEASREARAGEVNEELEALRRQAEENWNNYLRAVAELDNFRKRSARELETTRRYAAERLGQAILPVRDSLEAALASADNVTVETLLEGNRATLKLLDDALASVGIREIDPLGEPFDPAKHEAMSLQPSTEHAPNTVVLVIQKGYELHDRLLRPARVVVSAPQSQGDA
ncbi:MAG: nucleotide exchange factor GrpE [Gammaproteobacteria bacterium]|nr:nucleotide exchange factor GrpE [Gammaproteobacteria bacterium]